MKIKMLAVTSTNGKLTNGDDPDIYKWTSKEDQDFFFDLLDKAKLIVMGSATYESVKNRIKHKEGRLRIIMTNTPEKYAKEQIPGVLEFTSQTPQELCNSMIDQANMFLVGGSKVYSSFMKAGLINEIYLTIEPVIFGRGKPLFADEEFEANLKLVSVEKLNRKGTLLLKYTVEKA